MYQKSYGIIETLAPLHVGASAGEETGNLNLIFRDQFALTGIIPGSSIRGRFRTAMREKAPKQTDFWFGREAKDAKRASDSNAETQASSPPNPATSETPASDNPVAPPTPEGTTEGIVKFEYASILWLPVYCPNQPIVRVSCPSLLKRYAKIANLAPLQFSPYSYCVPKSAEKPKRKCLFFNLGFLPLKTEEPQLKEYLPSEIEESEDYLLLVVKDTEIAMIHDMALYRQSRVALKDDEKIVAGTSFFNVEALPEKTILTFPLAFKETQERHPPLAEFEKDLKLKESQELYFGGLESIGFGRTRVALSSPKST